MRQLSIIYLIICAVLLVGVTLISLSPDNHLPINQYGETLYALSTIRSSNSNADNNIDEIPLYFRPNNGQVNKKAKFYAQTPAYTLWMTNEGLVFDSMPKAAGEEVDTPRPFFHQQDVSRLMFLNANKNPEIIPLETTQHNGTTSSKAVLYKDIYEGIDLKICGNENQLEYTWIVKPGGNPGDIRFEYKNVKATGIDNQWNLAIQTQFGELTHQKPVSYQLIAGKKVNINSHFEHINYNTYGFKIKAYDRDHELIIDPLVSFELSTHGGRQ